VATDGKMCVSTMAPGAHPSSTTCFQRYHRSGAVPRHNIVRGGERGKGSTLPSNPTIIRPLQIFKFFNFSISLRLLRLCFTLGRHIIQFRAGKNNYGQGRYSGDWGHAINNLLHTGRACAGTWPAGAALDNGSFAGWPQQRGMRTVYQKLSGTCGGCVRAVTQAGPTRWITDRFSTPEPPRTSTTTRFQPIQHVLAVP